MKYIAVFVRKMNIGEKTTGYYTVKEKEFKPKDKTIDWDKGSVGVFLEKFSYIDLKGNYIYHYDWDSGNLINLGVSVKVSLPPTLLYKLIQEKVVEQMVRGATRLAKNTEIFLMIIPAICLGVGVAVGHFLLPTTQVVTVPAQISAFIHNLVGLF